MVITCFLHSSFLLVSCFLGVAQLVSANPPVDPGESFGQSWRIISFEKDAHLGGCSVFNVAFERGTNRPWLSRAWLATSSGLLEYDGYQSLTQLKVVNPSQAANCPNVP